jgi:hypothetical protein
VDHDPLSRLFRECRQTLAVARALRSRVREAQLACVEARREARLELERLRADLRERFREAMDAARRPV